MKKIIYILLILTPLLARGTTYYVHPDSSVSTISQVNALSLQPGDSVLFAKGNVWREQLNITNSGTLGNMIVYSSYGTGNSPQILGSDLAESWTATGTANIWVSGTSLTNYSTEYYPARIFFIEGDSVAWGDYVAYDAGFTNLVGEYDYAVNGTTYYIYSTTDPNTTYDAVEVTQRRRCISILDNNPESYIEVNGIDFKFARLAGFDAGYPAIRGATDLVVRNCVVGYIGARPSGYAYGIAAWHSNFLVENCTITDCGRRGVSINLYLQQEAGSQRSLNNIIVRNNVFKRGYHTTALDLSLQQTNNDTIQNVYFYNNLVDDSEFTSICSNCGSNQVFFQNGSGSSFINNIYVVGNVLVQSSARNVLFEGADTTYVLNNTIVGHNPNITISPYNNVAWNSQTAVVYYKNNILYDNLLDNSIQNHGIFIFDSYSGIFEEKDYNLYHSLNPGAAGDNRNFSAHRINSTGAMGYWNTTEWSSYLSSNTLFEQNSPTPQDPYFVNYATNNFSLTDSSTAVGTGTATGWVTVTDPLGVVDTINKYGYNDVEYSVGSWDIGAMPYSLPDTTATDIVTFTISSQVSSVVDTSDHTVIVTMPYGTTVTSLTPTITVSQTATIDPLSGVAQNFTPPVNYTVTAGDGVTDQVWTVTVAVESASTETDILTFTISGQVGNSVINATNHTVTVLMGYYDVLTSLTPTITMSNGATISPLSGTAQDFTNPVNYTVTAQDGTTEQVWAVTVTKKIRPSLPTFGRKFPVY